MDNDTQGLLDLAWPTVHQPIYKFESNVVGVGGVVARTKRFEPPVRYANWKSAIAQEAKIDSITKPSEPAKEVKDSQQPVPELLQRQKRSFEVEEAERKAVAKARKKLRTIFD